MIRTRNFTFLLFLCCFGVVATSARTPPIPISCGTCDLEQGGGGDWFGDCGTAQDCDDSKQDCLWAICDEGGHADCGNSNMLLDCAPLPTR
jgi:hypothetical protein